LRWLTPARLAQGFSKALAVASGTDCRIEKISQTNAAPQAFLIWIKVETCRLRIAIPKQRNPLICVNGEDEP
jgi:hypothetical protein